MKKSIYHLINFLREKKVLIPFMIYMFRNDWTWKEVHDILETRDYIYIPFDWRCSDEGWQFWYEIECEWKAYYVRVSYRDPMMPIRSKGYLTKFPQLKGFFDFLREEGVLASYMVNFHTCSWYSWMSIEAYLLSNPVSSWAHAFSYTDSAEGWDFWQSISYKWTLGK